MRINTRFHPSTPASYVQIVVLAGMMSLCASAQTPQSMTVSPDKRQCWSARGAFPCGRQGRSHPPQRPLGNFSAERGRDHREW